MTAMPHSNDKAQSAPELQEQPASAVPEDAVQEIGGRGGLEPTRFGDWEKNGRCIDF
jgi:hypothetical protein